jgi:uncharacterized integral membrane protein (TIGR00697 family)
MKEKKLKQAKFLYLCLAGVFISLLVSCNLIFLKFVSWEPFGLYTFIISVGLIPYPLTFLVTDLISEIYGEKKANDVVKVGLICAVLVMLITMLADSASAVEGSTVSDAEFTHVFGLTGAAVAASMTAYLLAQFIDIKVFHFWKRLTKGRHLWLRNNFSTIVSQFIDTLVVLSLLTALGAISWSDFGTFFIGGFSFKLVVAALDTPLFYLFTYWIKKHFGLGDLDELEI